MKNKRIISGMLAMALTFALVLAGCASTPAEPPDPAAEKLAADINAVKARSARVSGGATVRLSGSLEITSGLTVPEGVTLEVTSEQAGLKLRDSTLTVNGTVIARREGILVVDNSWAVINGSGTIRLKGKGHLIHLGQREKVTNRKLTLDGVTLVGVDNNDGPLVVTRDTTELVLKSGAITGNTVPNDGGGGVGVRGGLFTMEGGEISGNSATGGAGVEVDGWSGGTPIFVMSGGVIAGNHAVSGKGAGVSVYKGTFTMSGGTIYGTAGSLPAGTDASLANNAAESNAALSVEESTAKWGTGGAYTKGGVSQTGGSDIGGTGETLIATP